MVAQHLGEVSVCAATRMGGATHAAAQECPPNSCDSLQLMEARTAHVSRGGQVSIPAAIRHRWDTDTLLLEDRGDEVLLRPLPRDPLAAAVGSIPLPDGLTSDELRARARRDDAETSRRRRSR